MKDCPKCGAPVGDWREKCDSCGRWLVPKAQRSAPPPTRSETWVAEEVSDRVTARKGKRRRRRDSDPPERSGAPQPIYVVAPPGSQSVSIKSGAGGCVSCLAGVGGLVVVLVIVVVVALIVALK